MVDKFMSDWLRPTNLPKPTQTIEHKASNTTAQDSNPANFLTSLQSSRRKWVVRRASSNDTEVEDRIFHGKDYKFSKTNLVSMLAYIWLRLTIIVV